MNPPPPNPKETNPPPLPPPERRKLRIRFLGKTINPPPSNHSPPRLTSQQTPPPSKSAANNQNTPSSSDLSVAIPPPTKPLVLDLDLNDPPPPHEGSSSQPKAETWEKWPLDAVLPRISIPNDPESLCYLHGDLIEKNISPVGDITSQLPCCLTENKRFNSVGGYVLFCGRELDEAERARRGVCVGQFVGLKWKVLGRKRMISGGIDGDEIGWCFSLVLLFPGKVKSEWVAEEYVSSRCQKGDSSVVFLRRNNSKWNYLEQRLEEAEKKVKALQQNLKDAKADKKDLSSLKAKLDAAKLEMHEDLNKLKESREAFKKLEQIGASCKDAPGASNSGDPDLDEGGPRPDQGPYFLKLKNKMKGKSPAPR